ncbi:hypothetical protein [Streptomyces puniciscabiei]|uniref:hypothetical protein n=1 Tax=Streptomyces puniciscabiei TaxID=164348 RepID=UPI0033196F7E
MAASVRLGDLELSVCPCQKIILICLQTWRDTVELPAGLVEKRSFTGHPKYAEVIEALGRVGCAWQPYTPLTFDNQCAVQATPSGVVFVFEIPEGEDPVLNVAGPQPHHHDCPAATRNSGMPGCSGWSALKSGFESVAACGSGNGSEGR